MKEKKQLTYDASNDNFGDFSPLPNEDLHHILSFLTKKELANLYQTSKDFKELIETVRPMEIFIYQMTNLILKDLPECKPIVDAIEVCLAFYRRIDAGKLVIYEEEVYNRLHNFTRPNIEYVFQSRYKNIKDDDLNIVRASIENDKKRIMKYYRDRSDRKTLKKKLSSRFNIQTNALPLRYSAFTFLGLTLATFLLVFVTFIQYQIKGECRLRRFRRFRREKNPLLSECEKISILHTASNQEKNSTKEKQGEGFDSANEETPLLRSIITNP